MRFILVHKTVTYLMVVTSTLSVMVSGEVSPLASLLFLIFVAGSWFWESPRIDFARFELPWNIVTMLVLVLVGFQAVRDESLLSAGIGFILFLIVNKLYNRKLSRDYLQLYVLSFMQLIAGSAVDVELTYGLSFILYIVFGTWTLILFHLKREMEDNFLLKYGDSLQGRPVQVERVLNSRRLISGKFLLATSAVSLVVFLGSTLVFVLFPRIGFGLFFKKQRPGILMAGFSDHVELGQFGTVKDDPTVVMRVEFPGRPAGEHIAGHWRGVSFDQYDGRRWSKSKLRRRRLHPDAQGNIALTPTSLDGDETVQAIYLEPMETHVLFGLSRFVGVSLPEGDPGLGIPEMTRTVERDSEGDVLYRQNDDLAFRYTALSKSDDPAPQIWQTTLTDYRAILSQAPFAERYLQLPPGLDPEVSRLAREWMGGAQTLAEAVERIETHLRSDYQYSLTLTRDETRAPLEDFLFVQKRGHCEYFATALAVMLRTQGIGTRNVNGFLGGRFNEFGNYLAITQGEAHSWVEVWLPGRQWATRDATPVGPPPPDRSSLLETLAKYSDALKLRWYKYVIEYDLGRQVWMFQAFKTSVRDLFGISDGSGDSKRSRRGPQADPPYKMIAIGLLAAAVVAAVLYRLRRRLFKISGAARTSESPDGLAAADLYRRMGSIYAKQGHARPPAATAREYAELLRGRQAPALDVALEIIDVYEGARFGGGVLDEVTAKRLRSELERARVHPPASPT